MKNILILSGSARTNGNSSILCDQFIAGAQEAGNQTEKINVARMNIHGCLGCDYCYRNDSRCVQQDQMNEIREKMLKADIIVLASPIYFYSINSQLKTVIDRCYAFFNQLKGKTFYFIITCMADKESYVETMKASLRGFTCCIPEAKEGGIILGLGTGKPGDVKNTSAMTEAYQAGKAIR